MKNVKIVIGANFGDEGKGLITDYLASQSSNALVVRFNGGSQAGHTVVTPNKIRHSFHHFGSGTLAGTPTYLSKEFIVNPMMFQKELVELEAKGFHPIIAVNQDCPMTTPYDMLLNQIVETNRGKYRHGSCGLGIFETTYRHKLVPITFKDAEDPDLLFRKLMVVRDEYFQTRLRELRVQSISVDQLGTILNKYVIEHYIDDACNMLKRCIISDASILNMYSNLIFEGAQGLLLDQNNKAYSPNLTPSNTGMQNVARILREDMGYRSNEFLVEIIYVTRNYLTRHGAGLFPNADNTPPYKKFEDLTNVPNEYQGSLRFAPLDISQISGAICNDLDHAGKAGIDYKASLAVTCLDQVDDYVTYYDLNGSRRISNEGVFLQELYNALSFVKSSYLSYGPKRSDIKYNWEICHE